ncbi:MAG TPA: FAD-dependent oxidoreductase [Burkholderiaceae bacterium]|nr:FAD-dependent oxidoreductase [Burkholderiaceae bacterium]
MELACQLGRQLGPARVMLADSHLYHVWKPSLHEVAAGTLDIHQEGLSYQMLAHDRGFSYVYGALTALDPAARRLTVDAIRDADGELVLPERHIDYLSLVLAVGSVSHYFGVPGAAEHAISLNGVEDAERFRLTMLKLLTRTEARTAGQHGVDIVIVGGGATGVELAAELREASGAYATYAAYGSGQLDPRRDVRITVLEGAPRILAPLPQRVADAALALLRERAITVVTGTHVSEVGAGFVQAGATRYPADLCVWAAGIAAPPLLARLGLPTAKGGQIVVDATLAVPGHPDIYALGDCAACPGADGKPVPPRAQAAHQQAAYLASILSSREKDGVRPARPAAPYVYRDHGALVSVGQRTSVGSLMGALRGAHWFVEGTLARLMYASLHLMHHRAVLGTARTAVLALARFLVRRGRPLVKLH